MRAVFVILLLLGGCRREEVIAADPVTKQLADATTTPTESAPSPSAAPSAELERDWCVDSNGRANDVVAKHVRVSARWAVRAVLRADVADGGGIDPRVRCPMPEDCADDAALACDYGVRLGAPDSSGILRTKGWVFVNARTGWIGGSGTVTAPPIPLP